VIKKLVLYFIFAMLTVIIGCFVHITHTSSSLGRILLGTGVLMEVFVIYKMITHRETA
jgi:hypothetical protein